MNLFRPFLACLLPLLPGLLLAATLPSIGKAPLAALAACALLAGGGLCALSPLRKSAHPALLVFCLALIARACFFPLEPSDDLNRYVWEGWIQTHGVNPYGVPPDDASLDALAIPVRADVNHPHMTAIYPPGMQLVFRLLAGISTDPFFFKIAFTLLDLATLALLLDLLKTYKRHAAWGLLYAVHPLVLFSFAGEVHLDVFAVFWMTQALWCHAKGKPGYAFASIALAFHVKYTALVALPFFIDRHTWRRAWVFPTVGSIPFLAFRDSEGLFDSLLAFNTEMSFNGSLHAVATHLFGAPAATWMMVGLLALLVLGLRLCFSRPAEGAGLALLALLLCSPNAHFWYVTWLFPFLVLRPHPAGLAFTLSASLCFLSYGFLEATGVWRDWWSVTLLEYLPVFAFLIWSLRTGYTGKTLADAEAKTKVESYALLVPAAREDPDALRAQLVSLAALSPAPKEIWLIQPENEAPLSPAPAGVRLRHAKPGRGHQIAAAVAEATADVLVVCHADCRLESAHIEDMLASLNRSGRRGGALGSTFDHASLSPIRLLNRLRAGWGGLSFGDQVQFFRRDALADLGGFPALPLMEDVELSCRLKDLEQPLFLDQDARVSGRSWSKDKRARRALLILALVGEYLLRRFFQRGPLDTHDLYRRYYPQSPTRA